MDADQILDRIGAGVLVVDATGSVEYGNAGAAKILRRAPRELAGRTLAALFEIDPELTQTTEGETRREVAIPQADGATMMIGFSISPPCDRGSRTVLFQEIGAMLELRRERDRLLQLAALGDTLPSILHELRNPLASVTNTLELCIEESVPPLRDDLHAILGAVRSMNLMLQAVGGLVRPIHVTRHVAVDQAIREACRILEVTTTARGITLDSEIATLPLLPLDWGVISGVVFNLVKNAIDACRRGGVIRVRATLAAPDTFELAVSDNGAGMTPEVLARCRELFFTNKDKGSGIGLALCQGIAEKSGGSLRIESAVGAGTTVTLLVPVAIKPRIERM